LAKAVDFGFLPGVAPRPRPAALHKASFVAPEIDGPGVLTVVGGCVVGGCVVGGCVVGGSVVGGSVTGGSVVGGSVAGGSVVGATVLSGAVVSGAVESGAFVESGTVLSGIVESGAFVESGTVESGTVESGTVESGTVLSGAVVLSGTDDGGGDNVSSVGSLGSTVSIGATTRVGRADRGERFDEPTAPDAAAPAVSTTTAATANARALYVWNRAMRTCLRCGVPTECKQVLVAGGVGLLDVSRLVDLTKLDGEQRPDTGCDQSAVRRATGDEHGNRGGDALRQLVCSSMGQPVAVVEKSSSNPGIVRFEANRTLTGQGHMHFRSRLEAFGSTPADVLARRLFDSGRVAGVHLFSNMITVDLEKGYTSEGLLDLVKDLYVYYVPGVEPPSVDELMAGMEEPAAPAGAAPSAGGAELSEAAKRIPPLLLERSRAAMAKWKATH
jgi:hypothetical protein